MSVTTTAKVRSVSSVKSIARAAWSSAQVSESTHSPVASPAVIAP